MEMEQLRQVMISYLRRKDLYCRINALKALCGFGSPDALLEALLELLQRLQPGGGGGYGQL